MGKLYPDTVGRVNRRLRKGLLIGAGLLVLAGAYALSLVAFSVQRDNGRETFKIGGGRNGIGVAARVTSIDPAGDAVTVRLEFGPLGDYTRGKIALARPVLVIISTAKGRSELNFAAGSVMSPTEATVALTGGELLDYPFDRYESGLVVLARTPRGERVPVSMEVSTGFNGFRITTTRDTFIGEPIARFKLRRATTTIFFALFIDVIFWAVALTAFGLALRLVERRRKFEAGFTSFLAALLFAFPAVRNTLPGDPPIGALNDFLAFFWTEAVVAVAMIVLLVTYYVRRLPGAAPPGE